MKHSVLLSIVLLLCSVCCKAQSAYTIAGMEQGKNGAYLVKVTAVVKKVKEAQETLRRDAVDGVLFLGFSNADGTISQKPLVEDPNIRQTKADFFTAFFSEKQYERYATVTPSSFTSIKVKKGYETSALFLVDKEALQHYLEKSGVIKGFSNLW